VNAFRLNDDVRCHINCATTGRSERSAGIRFASSRGWRVCSL
jgi:hypothetical protein